MSSFPSANSSSTSIISMLAQTILATVYRTRFAAHASDLWRFIRALQQFDELPPAYELIISAIQQMYTTEGQVRVNELAASAGLSPRQFERHFKQVINIPPKKLLRIIRFEAARNRLFQLSLPHPNAVAHEFSYTDESHFIHDFKTIAGMTPATFTKNVMQRSMSGFYRTPDPRPPYHELISKLANGKTHDDQLIPFLNLARNSSSGAGNPES